MFLGMSRPKKKESKINISSFLVFPSFLFPFSLWGGFTTLLPPSLAPPPPHHHCTHSIKRRSHKFKYQSNSSSAVRVTDGVPICRMEPAVGFAKDDETLSCRCISSVRSSLDDYAFSVEAEISREDGNTIGSIQTNIFSGAVAHHIFANARKNIPPART